MFEVNHRYKLSERLNNAPFVYYGSSRSFFSKFKLSYKYFIETSRSFGYCDGRVIILRQRNFYFLFNLIGFLLLMGFMTLGLCIASNNGSTALISIVFLIALASPIYTAFMWHYLRCVDGLQFDRKTGLVRIPRGFLRPSFYVPFESIYHDIYKVKASPFMRGATRLSFELKPSFIKSSYYCDVINVDFNVLNDFMRPTKKIPKQLTPYILSNYLRNIDARGRGGFPKLDNELYLDNIAGQTFSELDEENKKSEKLYEESNKSSDDFLFVSFITFLATLLISYFFLMSNHLGEVIKELSGLIEGDIGLMFILSIRLLVYFVLGGWMTLLILIKITELKFINRVLKLKKEYLFGHDFFMLPSLSLLILFSIFITVSICIFGLKFTFLHDLSSH